MASGSHSTASTDSAHGGGHDHGHDQWHTHAAGEAPAQAAHLEEIPAFRVLGLGMLLWLGVVVVIAVIAVYYLAYANTLQITSEEYPERFGGENQAVQADQLKARKVVLEGEFLNVTPTWTDAQAGTVRIPMSKAMDRVVDQYAHR
jgi:hypothetical protein